jgi:Flp pilus assembly protein TadG
MPVMKKLPNKSRRLRHFLRHERDGATAIEFGIVALPFFMLLVALIEIGLVFFGNFTLENAVDRAARKIRTGEAQTAGFDAGAFKTEVCSNVYAMLDCSGGLKVDVRTFENFGGVALPPPLDGDGNLIDDFEFSPGNGGDIVVVRAFYEWDLIASVPGAGLGNMAGGSRLLAATVAFRNEPF